MKNWSNHLYTLLVVSPEGQQAQARHFAALEEMLEDPRAFDALFSAPIDVWEGDMGVPAVQMLAKMYAQEGSIPPPFVWLWDQVNDATIWLRLVGRFAEQDPDRQHEDEWVAIDDSAVRRMYADPQGELETWASYADLLPSEKILDSYLRLHPHAQAVVASRINELPVLVAYAVEPYAMPAKLFGLLDQRPRAPTWLDNWANICAQLTPSHLAGFEQLKRELQSSMFALEVSEYAKAHQLVQNACSPIAKLLYPVDDMVLSLPRMNTARQREWIELLSQEPHQEVRTRLLEVWLNEVSAPISIKGRLSETLDLLAMCVRHDWQKDTPVLKNVSASHLCQTFLNWEGLSKELKSVTSSQLNTLAAFDHSYGLVLSTIAQMHGLDFRGFHSSVGIDHLDNTKPNKSQEPSPLWGEFVSLMEKRQLLKEVSVPTNHLLKKKM